MAAAGQRIRSRLRRPSERFRREQPRIHREKLANTLAGIASRIVSWLPDGLRNGIADQIGMIWIRCMPAYKENVIANVGQVLGPDVPRAALERTAEQIFRQSARNFGELLRLRHLTSEQLLEIVPFTQENLLRFREARARSQGIVVATAHIGAFDILGRAIGAMGTPMTVITGRTTNRFLFDGVTHLRQGHNVTMVEPTPSGVRQVIRALRRGEVAGFVCDYDFFHNGIPVSFFGRETTLPPGAIRIARDTGALVMPMFPYREGKVHRLRIGEPFTVPRTSDVDADVLAGMETLRQRLEEGIGATPDQWVLFQRAWPSGPGDHSHAVEDNIGRAASL